MKVRKVVLGFGILVVYALVLWQGIQAFYPEPLYEDFCEINGRLNFGVPTDCKITDKLKFREQSCYDIGGRFIFDYNSEGCPIGGDCDDCQIYYDDAGDEYSKNVFFISLIVGVITFILGLAVFKVEPVGSALLGSGVWAIFYGTVWNWRNFGAGIKFVLLLIVLIVLIWIGLKLNNKRKNFFNR